MAGNTEEDHLIAAIWNLMCLAETEELRPEMQDIPSRSKKDQLKGMDMDGDVIAEFDEKEERMRIEKLFNEGKRLYNES